MLFRDTSLAKGDGFLALFAVNSISSWYSLKQLRAKIVRENDDDETVPMVIIANKNDLESSRQVDFEEVLDYCKHINCPVLETSAKTGLNVTESFRLLLDRVAELSPTKFKDCIILPPEPSQQNHRRRCVIS